jgi:hypothetical protein
VGVDIDGLDAPTADDHLAPRAARAGSGARTAMLIAGCREDT